MSTHPESDTILVGTSIYALSVSDTEEGPPNSQVELGSDVMAALQAETSVPIVRTDVHWTVQTVAPLVVGESYAVNIEGNSKKAEVIEALGEGRYELRTGLY